MSEWNSDRSAEERSNSAKKATITKQALGYIAPFLGHNHSDETKKLISEKSTVSNLEKSKLAEHARLKLINEANLELIEKINDTTLSLRCKTCDTNFSLTKQCFTASKFKINWCNTCHPVNVQYRSKGEIELFTYVNSLCGDAISTHRQLLSNRKEIDIFIPTHNLAIEYNGLYWHSSEILLKNNKLPTSDFEKFLELQQQNIRYIGIFEDEWLNKREIVESRLANILGHSSNKIPARKCIVKPVSSADAAKFCDQYHISGKGRSNVRYGLYHNDILVSVMTFSKSNISRKISAWEINRYCNVLNTTIIGGASKLFKKFISDHDPENVISYADSRWSEGNIYNILGFTKLKQTVPNYWYVPHGSTQRIHRYTLRKTKNDCSTLSEKELRTNQGYSIIYDCGSTKWEWKK